MDRAESAVYAGRSWARTANIVNPDEVFVENNDLSIPPVVLLENFDDGALAQPLPTHLVLLGAHRQFGVGA